MAGKNNTVSRVTSIIAPYAERLGLQIWDVQFVKEGADWYLRVFIDKEGGVTVDDCVDLTHAVSELLDREDPISGSYCLEVSSPGIERELSKDWHFEKYIGADVMMRLIRPRNNVRDFSGVLKAYQDGVLTVAMKDGNEISVNKKETSFVKLDDFNMDDFKQEI